MRGEVGNACPVFFLLTTTERCLMQTMLNINSLIGDLYLKIYFSKDISLYILTMRRLFKISFQIMTRKHVT